jgi:hypothetical protein
MAYISWVDLFVEKDEETTLVESAEATAEA